LKQEKDELEALENELSKIEKSDAEQEKNLHSFARDGLAHGTSKVTTGYDTSISNMIQPTILPDVERDPQAKEIVDQLRHHLDSMETNVESTKDIAAALATSKAALDVFNWRRLTEDEYRQVYGTAGT
jgi:CENP-Q, a CENPA-CAD centromere complex subunit